MKHAITILELYAQHNELNAPLHDREGEADQARLCREQADDYRKAIAVLEHACAPTEAVAKADARIFIGQPDSEAGNADPCNEALAAIEVMMLAQARQSASMALDCMRKNDIEGARFFAKDGVRLLEEAKKLVETKWNADVVLEDALESASKAFAEDDSGLTAPRITPADIEASIAIPIHGLTNEKRQETDPDARYRHVGVVEEIGGDNYFDIGAQMVDGVMDLPIGVRLYVRVSDDGVGQS